MCTEYKKNRHQVFNFKRNTYGYFVVTAATAFAVETRGVDCTCILEHGYEFFQQNGVKTRVNKKHG